MEKRALYLASCTEDVGKNRLPSSPNYTKRNAKSHRFGKWFAGVLVSVGIFAIPSSARAGLNRSPPPPVPRPQIESPPSRAAPAAEFRLPQVPRMEYGGGAFGLEKSTGGLSLVYEKEGARQEVQLSLPPAEMLGGITDVHYGEGWSAILARNQDTGEHYAIITLGAADVAAGRQLLPGNEFLNADCILLPEAPASHSFAEDKLFLFYGGGTVRVLDSSGRLRRLAVEGASEDSEAVKYRGLYVLMQANNTPVIFLEEADGGSWDAQAFDYDSSQLQSREGNSITSSGLSVRFLNSEGQPVELMVTVGEEGDLETADVEVR